MMEIKSKVLRNVLKIAIPFVAIPALVALGALAFDAKRHLFVSFGVAVLAVLFFMAGFEKKIIGSRRAVLVALMAALCVAGRFIRFVSPVAAITILAAIYLGKESGFLVGALAALLSNFYFGQGPWTPFQMLGWGLIGLFSGLLANPLKKSRAFLLFFGAVCGVAYSFIMDIWTVLWYNGSFSWALYFAALGTAVPYTCAYIASNIIFLWFLAKPIGEKLERIKIKYGV